MCVCVCSSALFFFFCGSLVLPLLRRDVVVVVVVVVVAIFTAATSIVDILFYTFSFEIKSILYTHKIIYSTIQLYNSYHIAKDATFYTLITNEKRYYYIFYIYSWNKLMYILYKFVYISTYSQTRMPFDSNR